MTSSRMNKREKYAYGPVRIISVYYKSHFPDPDLEGHWQTEEGHPFFSPLSFTSTFSVPNIKQQ